MNQKKINQSIEALIMNAPKNYVFNQNDLHLMRRYDKCEDSELNEQFVFGRIRCSKKTTITMSLQRSLRAKSLSLMVGAEGNHKSSDGGIVPCI